LTVNIGSEIKMLTLLT